MFSGWQGDNLDNYNPMMNNSERGYFAISEIETRKK